MATRTQTADVGGPGTERSSLIAAGGEAFTRDVPNRRFVSWKPFISSLTKQPTFMQQRRLWVYGLGIVTNRVFEAYRLFRPELKGEFLGRKIAKCPQTARVIVRI
jgi:hypothetical protein